MKRKNDKIRDFGRYCPTRFDRSFPSLWENLHDFNGSSLHPFNARYITRILFRLRASDSTRIRSESDATIQAK